MSNDPAICIEALGKRYRYGGAAPLSCNLRADLTDWMKGMFQRDGKRHATLHDVHEQHIAGSPEYFWALKDINLDIKQGEVVGIIGRNGAGKSTLLKILSRITPPTEGRITYHGRIASLLEVGTGFHRELTGRENIFLNGSILGMKRAEITRKFDEIVAFAEVEKFIDTPVKFYSSGMYVRLAFAVAAYLEPEILVVDEVLAVGDASFQKRCLGKMGEVAKAGRTVIFISHNMGTIAKLCSRAILLVGGCIACQGEPQTVIARYLNQGESETEWGRRAIRAEGYPFILHAVEILNRAGEPATQIVNHEPFRVRLTYELTEPMKALRVGFRLHAQDSTVVLSTTDCDHLPDQSLPRLAGVHVSEVEFPGHFLNLGRYYLWIGVDIPMVAAVLAVEQAASVTVEGAGGVAGVQDKRLGVVAPLLPWRTAKKAGLLSASIEDVLS